MPATRPAPRGPAELRTAGGLRVLVWPALGALGVDAVVTTRYGGVSSGPYESLNLGLHVGDDDSAVVENRRRAAGAIGASLGDLVVGDQVHGAAAAVVTAGHAGRGSQRLDDALTGTDALVTDRPGLVLVTLVADCVPIILVDPAARVLATVHAGWRGTVAGVAGAALGVMASLGSRPDRVVAGIGPGVSPRTYVVGPEVASGVNGRFGTAAGQLLTPVGAHRWLFDLPAANRLALIEAGVRASAVHVAPFDTADDAFYSDRARRPCGRFGLLARLR
jgi:polyphenol oxidase